MRAAEVGPCFVSTMPRPSRARLVKMMYVGKALEGLGLAGPFEMARAADLQTVELDLVHDSEQRLCEVMRGAVRLAARVTTAASQASAEMPGADAAATRMAAVAAGYDECALVPAVDGAPVVGMCTIRAGEWARMQKL